MGGGLGRGAAVASGATMGQGGCFSGGGRWSFSGGSCGVGRGSFVVTRRLDAIVASADLDFYRKAPSRRVIYEFHFSSSV